MLFVTGFISFPREDISMVHDKDEIDRDCEANPVEQ